MNRRIKSLLPRRTSAQVRQVMDTELLSGFAQTFSTKNRPSSLPLLSFSSRAHHLSALLPSRSTSLIQAEASAVATYPGRPRAAAR